MTVKFEDLKVLQANVMSKNTKQQQRSNKPKPKTAVREPGTAYLIDQEVSLEEFVSDVEIELFTPDDIAFLSQLPNHPITQLPNYPIT